MNRSSLWRVSVTTTPDAEDAVSELLARLLGQPVSSYLGVETNVSTVSVYLPQKIMRPASPGACRCSRGINSPLIRSEILAGLSRLKKCGLKIGSGKVAIVKIRRQDWVESWKRHFKPVEFGNALLVKSSWSKRRARKNQAVVVLDPGLSFGTGQHPTTAFCLRALASQQKIGTRRSFLDLGTGSGILAIAAAKLGYSPVDALDFDPEAVRVARANARRNRVYKRLRILRKDVAKLPVHPSRQYDLICANLISTLLMAEHQRIVAHMQRGGMLVLAGILKSEFSRVQKTFEGIGLKLAAGKIEKEWCSGSFYYAE